MPRFVYQAINESGNTVSGVIEADSMEMATNLLSARELIPSRVKEAGAGASEFSMDYLKERLARIKTPELILFTKQFRTMIHAGVPILTIFQVMENQTENLKLKRISSDITQNIKGGSSLHDAFKRHPDAFSPLYCRMVQAGETSGALPEVLSRLIYIIEHEHKIKSDIKSALQYPIIVAVFLGVAFFVLLTFVIPKFVNIFISAGLKLPLPTKICIAMYNLLANYWYIILFGLVAGIIAIVYYFKTEQGQYVKDASLMKIPVLGNLIVKASMSRFASIFAILQSSGVAVLEAMRILSGTIGNTAISKEFDRIRDRIEEGEGISGPLKSARYFTPMVINMVAIGEESGKLDEMLSVVSAHYDEEVEYAVGRLSEAIAPLLTVGLAAVVGFFALSIFLPMWDLTKMVRPG
ncbi:MAG: type II secretion system F family protein [Pseudomonadota bacterium]